MTSTHRAAATSAGGSLIKSLADNSDGSSLATRMRRARFALFLSLLSTVKGHIAILDIGMPLVDGYAAARMLRQRAWSPGLLLYALTGWGDPGDRDRTRDAGFDRHFVKPVSIDELLTRLADDLERRDSRGGSERAA